MFRIDVRVQPKISPPRITPRRAIFAHRTYCTVWNMFSSQVSKEELAAETTQMRYRLKAAAYTLGGVNWKKLFRFYDRDNSGQIGYTEFKRLVRTDAKITSSHLPDKNLRAIFKLVDRDDSGEIDYTEFLAWVENPNLQGSDPVFPGAINPLHATGKNVTPNLAVVIEASPDTANGLNVFDRLTSPQGLVGISGRTHKNGSPQKARSASSSPRQASESPNAAHRLSGTGQLNVFERLSSPTNYMGVSGRKHGAQVFGAKNVEFFKLHGGNGFDKLINTRVNMEDYLDEHGSSKVKYHAREDRIRMRTQKLKEDMVAPARRRAPAPPAPPAPPPAPPAPRVPVDLPTENEEYLTAVRIEEPADTSLIKEQPFQTERVNQTQFPGHEHQSAQLSRTDEALHRVKAQLSRTDEALHKAIRENQSFRTENESLRAKTTAFAVQNEQLSRENEELTIMCNFLIKTLDKHGINVEEESLQ